MLQLYLKYLKYKCSILCFNKRCICWQNSFVLIKIHGKTTIKNRVGVFRNKEQRKISGYKKDELTAGWKQITQRETAEIFFYI